MGLNNIDILPKNICNNIYNNQALQNYSNYNQTIPQIQQISNNISTTQVNEIFKNRMLALSPTGYKELQTFKVPFYDNGKLYELNNGQKVVIIPKHGPTAIKTFVKVGSFNEPDNIRGVSHYIEHNIFNGSKHLAPGEFAKIINNTGSKYNASTNFSCTDYYILSQLYDKNDFEKFIAAHADMLQNPSFTIPMLEKEKGPVISEIHMYEDDPYDKIHNLMLKNLFNIKADYQGLIAGSEKNIKNITREDVLNYYNKWYTPDNMITVVVGEVNPNQAIKIVSKYFNSKNSKPSDKYYEYLGNSIQKTRRTDVKTPNINSVMMNMAFVGTKNNNIRETVGLAALCYALAGYDNARLTKILKPFNTKPSASMEVISSNFNDPQVINFNLNFKTGEEENGLKAVYAALNELIYKPLSEVELQIIKNNMKDNLANMSEHSMGITNLVGNALTEHGNLAIYTDSLKAIDSLTSQEIQNLAKKYLDLNKVSIVVLHPEFQQINNNQLQKPQFMQTASKKINFGSNLSQINKSNLTEYVSPNNLHLILNDDPAPIKTSAVINLQTDNFPPSKPGVRDIITLMLNKGTRKHSEEEISNIIDLHTLGINSSADFNSIFINANCPCENLPLALDLMKEILYNPDFSEKNFNKAKEEVKNGYLSMMKDPKDRAYEFLYGNQPYGYSPRKILENIDKIKLQDCIDFYNYIIQNSQAKIVITGPITKTPNLHNNIFRSLQSGFPLVQKPHYSNTFINQPLAQTKVITEAEDRNQADIVQIFKIKESGNVKDQAALLLLNEILGGNSESRLFLDLRESQKLAYKVRSSYTSDRKTGEIMLEIKTTTKNNFNNHNQYENVIKSIEGFKKHINNLIQMLVSREEAEKAKRTIKFNIELDAESSLGKTGLIQGSFSTPYGLTYINELLKAINNITPQDIQKAANLYLNKPSVISMIASADTIKNTKNYLSSLGELKNI
ncbi:MAG: pitrilysin family protein [bacterium]